MSILRRLSLYLPPLLLAVAIFVASSRPMPEPVEQLGLSDKTLHFAAYAALAFLLARMFAVHTTSGWTVATLAVLVAGLYGVSDECHQALVPTRSPDVIDAWADLAGALIGAAAWSTWQRQRQRRS